ncbi:hypothetical protein, partial [Streptomyces phaeofaciens]|uniref:hypothetical protein n=1 Tax=Streptomyces phaeofaciens TaxID=68254 RepID=UPI0036C87155
MHDEGKVGPWRDNAKQQPAAGKRSVGRSSKVEDFIRTQCDPEWLARLRGDRRQKAEASNALLRERFHRPLLALIVLLEGRILEVHGTRDAFIRHIEEAKHPSAGMVNKSLLNAHLGGRRAHGPEWWLAELIGTHCVRTDENAAHILMAIAQMWCAAHGKTPDAQKWPDPLEPASPFEIAELVDTRPAGHEKSSSRPSRGAARLAAILDALPDALLLVNANGTVV